MVLHAATSGAGVEEALRLAGETRLAADWAGRSRADPSADADLRYRVMLAIEKSPAEARLLSPPSVGDITEALAASGADVLVYLLAAEDGAPGLAVLVDQDKDVRQLRLPGLVEDGDSPAARFSQARRTADARARALEDLQAQPHPDEGARRAAATAANEATRAWEGTLDPLCEWAWRVAIGPVLDAMRERGGSRDWRIVLIPCGQLGLIPWHAARHPGSGRYACQHAVLSYASSARQFIDATRCQPRPWGQAPVLISDHRQSLWLTAVGIGGLHAEHYRAGKVFGWAREKLADPAVESMTTSDAVRGALPGPAAAALDAAPGAPWPGGGAGPAFPRATRRRGSAQGRGHLAPGPRVAVRPAGPGEFLRLVVLASCLSDVTDADYDEALTLADRVLVRRAGGVVAARWRVPERATVLLMAAFHRYLNAGASPAWARCARPSCGCSPRGGTSRGNGLTRFAMRLTSPAIPADRT